MTKKVHVFKKVPLETRLHIMKLYFEEGRSANTLAREYEVSVKTIGTWTQNYKRDGGLDVQRRGRPGFHNQEDYKERYEILKKFTAYLKEVDAKKRKDSSTNTKRIIPPP
jgi:transposase